MSSDDLKPSDRRCPYCSFSSKSPKCPSCGIDKLIEKEKGD